MNVRLLETKRTELGLVALLLLEDGRRVASLINGHATRVPEIAMLSGIDQMRVAAVEALGIEWRAPECLDEQFRCPTFRGEPTSGSNTAGPPRALIGGES